MHLKVMTENEQKAVENTSFHLASRLLVIEYSMCIDMNSFTGTLNNELKGFLT